MSEKKAKNLSDIKFAESKFMAFHTKIEYAMENQ